MKKKKPYTGKKRGPKVKGSIIRVPTQYKGQDPMAFFKEPPRRNVEDDVLEPEDKIAKHKYPPPRKGKIFREKWALFIDNVTGRKNFHTGHLETLRILCDCFVEYEQLREFIQENGQSYCAIGRAGEQWKMYPHVTQLNRVKESISVYSKMLDLLVKKDEGVGGNTGDDDDWK
jgi:hypothetical protein